MNKNSLTVNKLWMKIVAVAIALSMSFFTSCRSYEDDICSLQERMDKMQKDLEALQNKVVKEVISRNGKLVIIFTDGTEKEVEATDLVKLSTKDGEWYINGKPTGVTSKGEKGDTGAKGDRGEKGDTGDNGKDGKNGVNGKDGKNGVNGKDGKNGVDGKDGKNGINGKDGVNGKDGKDGVNGKDGKDGVNGKDGKDGVNGKDGKDGVNGKDGVDGAKGDRGEKGEKGDPGKDGKDGKTPVVGISDDGYWTINGEKTSQTAKPVNGSAVCVIDEEGGYVTIDFYAADGHNKVNSITFLLENARLTSVLLEPDAVYQGFPAIEFEQESSYFKNVKAAAKPSKDDDGDVFNDKLWYWKKSATDAEATAFLRLNPSRFGAEYIKDVTIRTKDARVLRSLDVSDNRVPANVVAPKDGKWMNNFKNGLLQVGLKDYLAGGSAMKKGTPAEQLPLVQFDVTTTKDSVHVYSDWAVLYMTDGGLKQPYIFLKKDQAPEKLAPRYDVARRETLRNSARVLEIDLRKDTDLKTVLEAYKGDASTMANLLDVEDYNLRYEFAQMPRTSSQTNNTEYYKITKDGIVTPTDSKGNAYKPDAEGRSGIVQVRLYMKDQLVSLAYLRFFITKVDPIEKDDFYNYWEESYDGQGKAGNKYEPIFTSNLISGAADKWTTTTEWAQVNYLKKWDLSFYDFTNRPGYSFMKIADSEIAPKPAGVDEDHYLAGTEDFAVNYNYNTGVFTIKRLPDSRCLEPGTYVVPVYFKQDCDPNSRMKAYPMHIVVYFKIQIVDPSKAEVDKVVKNLKAYKMPGVWNNGLVYAKGLPSTSEDGYIPTLDTKTIFNSLSKFQEDVKKAAKVVYGDKIAFTAEVISVNGDKSVAKTGLYKVEHVAGDGDNFTVTRTGVLEDTELVTVSYGFASTQCPQTVRELFKFTISFEHAAKYILTPDKIKDKQNVRVNAKGEIEIRDNHAEHSVAIAEILKMFSTETQGKKLYDGGYFFGSVGQQVLGSKKFNVNVTLPEKHDFVEGKLLSITPSPAGIPANVGLKINWKNLVGTGHAEVIRPVEIKATIEIDYGTAYKYKRPLVIRIMPDSMWNFGF